MIEKDVMVIVPTGPDSGVQMWKSEAIMQGLSFIENGKKQAPVIEDKQVDQKEDKAIAPSDTEDKPVSRARKK